MDGVPDVTKYPSKHKLTGTIKEESKGDILTCSPTPIRKFLTPKISERIVSCQVIHFMFYIIIDHHP